MIIVTSITDGDGSFDYEEVERERDLYARACCAMALWICAKSGGLIKILPDLTINVAELVHPDDVDDFSITVREGKGDNDPTIRLERIRGE